jgi:hypothetical protein
MMAADLHLCEIPFCNSYATAKHHVFTRGAHGSKALVPDNEMYLCTTHHTGHKGAHTLGRETWSRQYGLEDRVEKARRSVYGQG